MASEQQLLETRQLLTLLEKVHKTLRLYQSENEVSRRLESELAATAGRYLERWGQLELVLGEHAMQLDGEVVYRAVDRTDSLAFLFHRDGMRRLCLLPGLDGGELRALLDSLIRVSVATNDADDLVTLFWEKDFSHIRYFAVEELAQTRRGPSVEDQLALPFLGGDGAGISPAEELTLDDLRRDVARMPVRECVLSEAELDGLQAEIAADEAQDPLLAVVDLAVDLSLLEATEDELENLRDAVVAGVELVLEEGPMARLIAAAGRIDELARGLAGSSPAFTALHREAVAAMARALALRRFFECLERDPPAPTPGELAEHLRRLGPAAMPALVPALEVLQNGALRRTVAQVLVAAGEVGARTICGHLGLSDPPTGTLLDEILYVARHLGGAHGLQVLRQLLAVEDEEVRRQAARALGPYQDGPVGQMWIELLTDHDPVVRGLALTAVVRGGRPELAQAVADLTMSPHFEDCSVEEKCRCFAAVARLGGTASVPWFREILERPRRRHFLARSDRDLVTAVVHGITQVPGQDAAAVLADLAGHADRHVRAACKKALKEAGDG